jgi:uncharacterized coiled-coil DUF342 family protein
MTKEKYTGYDKVLKDALVAARGDKVISSIEQKILTLEHKLDTARLSPEEITDIQKQLKKLRSS